MLIPVPCARKFSKSSRSGGCRGIDLEGIWRSTDCAGGPARTSGGARLIVVQVQPSWLPGPVAQAAVSTNSRPRACRGAQGPEAAEGEAGATAHRTDATFNQIHPARAPGIVLSRRHTALTLREIGERRGGSDFAAVSQTKRRMEAKLRNNKWLEAIAKHLPMSYVETGAHISPRHRC
jgi:hypothetical protein